MYGPILIFLAKHQINSKIDCTYLKYLAKERIKSIVGKSIAVRIDLPYFAIRGAIHLVTPNWLQFNIRRGGSKGAVRAK
jgi:hypothetical protein